jgi:putative transposase
MEYSKQGHCVYYTRYHIVLATRYRRKIFNEGIRQYLRKTLRSVERKYPEIKIKEASTDVDHLHVLVEIPPKMSVSDVVRLIKSNTGTALRKRYNFLKYVYYGRGGIWSVGYFVSTSGISEEVIRRYVEHQGQEDRGQAQLEF